MYSSERTVNPEYLADRCMDFLKAHPDCQVNFQYDPKYSYSDGWVFAHWYETGRWTGDSGGIKATADIIAVEDQTRFFFNNALEIENMDY
jgi:hypothetical protein